MLTLLLIILKLKKSSRLTHSCYKSYEYLKSQLESANTLKLQQEQINLLTVSTCLFLNVHQPPAALCLEKMFDARSVFLCCW